MTEPQDPYAAPDPNQPPPATSPPSPGYGAPPPGYGAPPPGYGPPPAGYGPPPPGYGPPPPGYGAPPPAWGAPPPGYPAPGWAPYPVPKTNALAIVSLVGAFLCTPVGLICGIIALNQIKRTGEQGKGLAIAGIVVSAVSILFLVIVFGAALSTFDSCSGSSC